MKKLIVPILVLFFLVLLPNVKAELFNPYNATVGFRLFPYTILSNPMDMKVACHPAGFHCLGLIYENNTFFGRGVKVWYTTDFFQNVFARTQVGSITVDFSSYVAGYYDNFHLPFDVTYTNGQYYFFIENAMYSFDGTTLNSLGNMESHVTAGKRWGLGFINETHFRSFESINAINTESKTFSKMKGTVLGDSYSIKCNWSDAVGNPTLRETVNLYDGTKVGSIPDVAGCSVGSSCNANVSLGTFPTDFSGLFFWDGSVVHYERFKNSSWSIETTDVSSYGTSSVLVRAYGSSYLLNSTDSSITDTNQIWAWTRRRATGDQTTTSGVWITNLPLTPIRVWGEGFDIGNRRTENVNISVRINCTLSGGEFVSTASGVFVNVFTPCQNDNEVTINTFNFQPNTVHLNNFSMTSACFGVTNTIRTTVDSGFYKPYDYTIRIKDTIFGDNVDGATVILDLETQTSNSEGIATFEVFPIDAPSMTIGSFNDYPECTQFYQFTGASKSFGLTISKTGYETLTDNLIIARSPFNVETDFDTSKIVFLTPLNTEVEVHVLSKDGIEISPSSVTITLEGSNATFWNLNNQLLLTNVATVSPATFILLNNTGTFPINVTVDYFGEFVQLANVTTGDFTRIDVFLNATAFELPCFTDNDCSPSLCTGNFYKDFLACTSNVCTYQTFDCGSSVFCDDVLGCVDAVSLTNCTRDSQCNNSCVDGFTMLNNKCGSDGFCKGNFIECSTSCNQTLGYCQELSACVEVNEMEFRAGYIRPSDSLFRGGTVQAFCDFSNANKFTCGFPNGFVIKKSDLIHDGATFDDVLVTPEGWVGEFINDQTDLKLYAVSIFCNKFCNMSWVFCANGCDIDTGQCKGTQRALDDTFATAQTTYDIIAGFWFWWDSVFPDIHSQSLMWLIIGIFLILGMNAVILALLPKIVNLKVDIGKEYDIIIFTAWIFIGSVAGRFYTFVWIVLTILAVFLLSAYFINKQRQVA